MVALYRLRVMAREKDLWNAFARTAVYSSDRLQTLPLHAMCLGCTPVPGHLLVVHSRMVAALLASAHGFFTGMPHGAASPYAHPWICALSKPFS